MATRFDRTFGISEQDRADIDYLESLIAAERKPDWLQYLREEQPEPSHPFAPERVWGAAAGGRNVEGKQGAPTQPFAPTEDAGSGQFDVAVDVPPAANDNFPRHEACIQASHDCLDNISRLIGLPSNERSDRLRRCVTMETFCNEHFHTPANSDIRFEFPDGTEVWIPAGSTRAYVLPPPGFRPRR